MKANGRRGLNSTQSRLHHWLEIEITFVSHSEGNHSQYSYCGPQSHANGMERNTGFLARSSTLLLVLVSAVVLDFVPRWHPMTIFRFRNAYVFENGVSFSMVGVGLVL
jgi:hypothetical protein